MASERRPGRGSEPVEDYLCRAAHFKQMAETARDPVSQEGLLVLARLYEQMARDARRKLAR